MLDKQIIKQLEFQQSMITKLFDMHRKLLEVFPEIHEHLNSLDKRIKKLEEGN